MNLESSRSRRWGVGGVIDMDARRGVMFLMSVVLVAIWSSLSPTCRAAKRVMVVYGNPPGRDLTLYDVQATRFEDEALEGFVEALADAQLLYVGQYTGDAASNIFGVPERAEAVKALLACGDGHIDVKASFETLWQGRFRGWMNIDTWQIPDPYDACLKAK